MHRSWLLIGAAVGPAIVATDATATGGEPIEVAKIHAAMWSYMAFAVSVTLVKIAALVLGYFIAKLGYTTMMAGVHGKDSVELSALGTKFKFKGVTPGLALGIIGVLMMGWALSTKHHFSSQVETTAIQHDFGEATTSQPTRGKKDEKRAPGF